MFINVEHMMCRSRPRSVFREKAWNPLRVQEPRRFLSEASHRPLQKVKSGTNILLRGTAESFPGNCGISSFLVGLSPGSVPDEFKACFEKYGVVVDHPIMMDRATGRSRGFGFITFDSEQAVEAVLSQGKMHEIAGKQASFIFACPCLVAS